MRVTKILTAILFSSLFGVIHGQDDEVVHQTFLDTRVVNGNSVEINEKSQMKFIIAHRFGVINNGLYDLFGLDDGANMRMGLDYGLTNRLTIGAGRSSFQKMYDVFWKYKIAEQKNGEKKFPFSLALFSGFAINTNEFDQKLQHRFSYTYQLLFARKFSNTFSWQIMPTIIHRNLLPIDDVKNDVISIGNAFRYQVSKSVSLQAEYYYNLPDQLSEQAKNSLSFGVDIDTKGHVFQLHISNSTGMTENLMITNTNDDWADGGFRIGFNITRDFVVRGKH